MEQVNATWVPYDLKVGTLANSTWTVEDLKWMVIVDCVILTFTLIGAGAILASMAWFEYKGRPSTVRTRLVQALVVSDLNLGVVGMIGTARRLQGYDIANGSNLCDGLGLLLVSVLFTEHLWTFTLAIATFLILIYPLHWSTILLEKFWFLLWAIVWVIAVGVGVLGYFIVGYTENGGICYYGSNAGLYGELMQFIPRACVFITISILYTRLFVFLRRPDKIRSPYSNSPTNGNGTYNSEQNHTSYVAKRHKRRLFGLRKPAGERSKAIADIGPKDMSRADHESELDYVVLPLQPVDLEVALKRWEGPGEIPPWERLNLPTFEVNGERFGGPSTNAPGTGAGGMWSDWKGLGSRTTSAADSKKRPSTTSGSSGSQTAVFAGHHGTRGSSTGSSATTLTSQPPVSGSALRSSDPVPLSTIYSSRHASHDLDQNGRVPTLVSDSVTPSTSSSQLGEMVDITLGTTIEPRIRRASANDSSVSSSIASGLPPVIGYVHKRGSGEDDLLDDEDAHAKEDEEWDLTRILQSAMPDEDRKRNRSAATSEEYELVPESMSSYLNRKTSMLMLYFPLAYVLLFSVSLIRLIYDFISDTQSTPLRAVSRWFVFSQGIVDALIYGVVEWHTKRVVRKKVRKGHFSPSHSRNSRTSNPGAAFSNAIRSLGGGGSGGQTKKSTGGGLNPSSRGHNVSFQDAAGTRSILAELDMVGGTGPSGEGDGSRKSSKVEFEDR